MISKTKPASGLLALLLLAAVVLSACMPLPATMAPAQTGEVAVPPAVGTAEPQVAETAVPETPAPQIAESAVPEASPTIVPQAMEPTASAGPTAALEGTLWTLVSYADENGETADVLPGTEITAQFNDGTVSGTAGCNNYFATYEVDGDQITVGVGGTTMMACEEAVMVQESAYMSNLTASAAFLITENALEIADAGGRVLLTYEVSQPIALTDTLWLLTMYNNGKEALVSTLAGTEITAVFGKDESLYGSAGCNSYNAGFSVEGDSMTIAAPATTRMMCGAPDGVMEQEAAFLATLPLAATYSILGDELDVVDANGNTLLVFAAGTSSPLTGVTWGLTAFNNERAITSVIIDTEITAIFGEDGLLTGSAGCNAYSAPYSIDGDKIFIGMAATTLMMCAEPAGIMEQETEYLAAIQKAARYEADSERLTLFDAEGRTMANYALQSGMPPQPAAEAGTAPAIIGAPWRWVVTLYNDDTKAIPENPEDYVLELLPDGQLKVKADCNTAEGTYSLKDTQLSIEVTASTMMACGPGSLGDQFVKDLNASQAYLMDGEDLIIMLKLDTGSMRLEVPESVSGAGPSTEPATPQIQPTAKPEPATPEVTGSDPADILGVIWKWENFTPATGELVTVDSPEAYEFMLLPNGIIRIKADCNYGSGAHWIDADGAITIEVLALTRAQCPPDSLSEDFVSLLNQVSAYGVDEGNLQLAVGGDGGTMQFSPAE